MAWFKKTRKPIASSTAEKPSRVPEGLWIKCPGCTQLIYKKDLEESLNVCPKCGHHFRISAAERLRALFDDGRYTEHFPNLISIDPLQFTDTKPYRQRLQNTIAATGLKDAVIVATGQLDGLDVVIAAMEYSFIGGSMGVVVGEKIARAVEMALERRQPVIVISCSGGARMMEGALSLMQMAKVSAALARLDRAELPVHLGADRSDDRRRDRELRHARRSEHRRAEGADRLRRAARHRADDPAEAARRIPAQRVPRRARHARPGGRSPRHERRRSRARCGSCGADTGRADRTGGVVAVASAVRRVLIRVLSARFPLCP